MASVHTNITIDSDIDAEAKCRAAMKNAHLESIRRSIDDAEPNATGEDLDASYLEYQLSNMRSYAETCRVEVARVQQDIDRHREHVRQQVIFLDSKLRELRLAEEFITEAESIARL